VESLEACGVQVERAGDLRAALGALRARGIVSLLVEGGGRLAGSLLAAGVVDRYYWVQSPLWLGVGGASALAGLPSVQLAGADRWRVVERRALGQDTLLVLDRS
jgi:diaminohydroxyphosphoribosylaminopyrimidine deaminase/5-amino-6-(5-phosphoribosylamino)uracil reductase